MHERVAICAVAETKLVRCNTSQRFQGMAWEVVEALLGETGLDFAEQGGIDTAISVSDDVYDGRTISDNAMTDVLGAHFRCEEKVAQDGAQAIYYAAATILSGHTDLVLVVGHCKESQPASRNQVTHLAFDPFFTRPIGLDGLSAAALQAQAYMARSGVTDRHLAKVVARARALARAYPAQAEVTPLTEDEVLGSPLCADPLRELHCHPVTDGAVGLIVASAARAPSISKAPIWIRGVGNAMDGFFLGERELGSSAALRLAATRAYARAGIAEPREAFDLVELSDPYAYQLPMWAEGLGLCPDRGGGRWLDEGGPDRMKVNLSGGTLAGYPLPLGGLGRVAAAVRLLRAGAAGSRTDRPARGLAHGVMGPAGQFHSVVVLEAP